MHKVVHIVALEFNDVESINTDLSGAGLVPDFKIKCILCANLPAIAHCRILLGLAQWDLAPDTLRVLCLGFYPWCLHAKAGPDSISSESRAPISWQAVNLCSHAVMTVISLRYFGAAKL